MTSPIERCDACGFDATEWDVRDTRNTLKNLATLPQIWIGHLDDEVANTRTAPDRWSIAEYVDHLREVAFGMRMVVEVALDEPGKDLGPQLEPPDPGEPRDLDLDAALRGLAAEASALHGVLLAAGDDAWEQAVTIGERPHSIGWAARHAVHDLMHHLRDMAAIRDQLRQPTGAGVISHLAASDGGIPKTLVDTAEVGRRGLLADRQATRQHHGRPWQALCLWSTEVIQELAGLGNPIGPGHAGENLTISGLDWGALHGGQVLRVGDVVCQLSSQAIPCAKNNRWFTDGNAQQIHHERRPAWTRWYASVLEPGTIEVGDPVTIEPALPLG